MATRFLGPALLAGGVTAALFWMMMALIATEEIEINTTPRTYVQFVEVRQDHPPPPKVRKILTRPPVPDEPVIPRLTTTDPTKALLPGLRDPAVRDLDGRDRRDTIELRPADGDAVPMVRIAPRYPERALARGIEGRVLVEFTITASGNVRDAHVVAAEPSAIFNRSAVEAVSQWRYTPKIVDGNPVERPGMRISIPFRRGSDESI